MGFNSDFFSINVDGRSKKQPGSRGERCSSMEDVRIKSRAMESMASLRRNSRPEAV
jgi:hypothetical protein